MQCFEDAGYFCVDNLPPEMISSLADLFELEGSKVERAAVVSDARGGQLFADGVADVLDELDSRGLRPRLLFLDASEATLIDRYKETRRRHPMGQSGQIAPAIAAERALLEPLRERADVVIDTTDLPAARLRTIIADKMLPTGVSGRMAVTFLTFGFKHGAPRDCGLLFDVRFLPNPHYEPELRDLTGLQDPVREYVENAEGIGEFYERLEPLLSYLLPAYVHEGKAHLTIGIGCTGGRHRSVVIAEHLAAEYGDDDSDYLVDVVHRDIDKPPRRA